MTILNDILISKVYVTDYHLLRMVLKLRKQICKWSCDFKKWSKSTSASNTYPRVFTWSRLFECRRQRNRRYDCPGLPLIGILAHVDGIRTETRETWGVTASHSLVDYVTQRGNSTERLDCCDMKKEKPSVNILPGFQSCLTTVYLKLLASHWAR